MLPDKMVVNHTGLSPIVWQTLLLAGLNLPVTLNYFGILGSFVYAVTLIVTVLILHHLGPFARDRIVILILFSSLLLQVFLLVVIAPAFDARMDRDDALVLWWQRLWQGVYPYAEPTSIGNPISVLPALHLLAVPFVLIGNIGFMELVAFILLAGLLWLYYYDREGERAVVLGSLSISPLVMLEIVGRSDLILNSTLLMAAILLLYKLDYSRRSSPLFVGVMIGFCAATRFAVWPALFPLAGFLLAKAGIRSFIYAAVCAGTTFALLVLPFVVWDPFTFFNYAPFGVNATKLGGDIGNQFFWLGATIAAACWGAFYAYRKQQMFTPVLFILITIVLGTWSTFFYDVTYAQLIFVPALFFIREYWA